MSNGLASAGSAYLRSAAHQPVAWAPWGEEPFRRAAREDKPVLLDIGAVWCHWCHVMDAESYDDPDLAALLNERFVCIKVDRDERPDVDARYQRAVQGLTGQGGWPLTAFLDPAGHVFHGGTYFPPDGKYGRPGFRTVLERVAELYRTARGEVGRQAALVQAFVAERLDESAPGTWDRDLLGDATTRILALADPVHGGFGGKPKFPHPAACALLLRRWHAGPTEALLGVVTRTLDGMANGGIRDHLGGGFHRYSTDERWIIPHFEKMSHDNSELLRVYADAYAATGRPVYREVARETLGWVRDTLAHPVGGYGASQDADQGPNDDGDYFTWSLAELDRILDPEEARFAIARYGIGTIGRMPHDPSRNVLFVAESADRLSERLGLPRDRIDALAAAVAARLRAARAERTPPFVDPTRYAAWNAMMASACLRAGLVLDEPWAVEHGIRSLVRLHAEQSEPDRVAHTAGAESGLLEDQVQTASAAIDGFEATGDPAWLEWATALMERAGRELLDPERGGYFDRPATGGETGLLATRARPIQDGPTPSGNGVAGQVLARLAEHTQDDRWRRSSDALLAAFAEAGRELGALGSAYLLALDWALHPCTHLVVTGPAGDDTAERMHREALAAFLPRAVITRIAPGREWPGRLSEPVAALARDPSRVAAYACTGTDCLAPAGTVPEWRERLAASGALSVGARPGAVPGVRPDE